MSDSDQTRLGRLLHDVPFIGHQSTMQVSCHQEVPINREFSREGLTTVVTPSLPLRRRELR